MYLEHVELDVESDIQALSWYLAHICQTGRIARWAVRLSAFKFVPHHIKGTRKSTLWRIRFRTC
jgi:hypothetical protein